MSLTGKARLRLALCLAPMAMFSSEALAGGQVTPPPRTPGWQVVVHQPGMSQEELKRTKMCRAHKDRRVQQKLQSHRH